MNKLNKGKLSISISILILITGCNSSINKTSAINKNINNPIIIAGLNYENKPFTKEYTWDDANRYCKDKGWRLPTRVELAKVANIPLYKIDQNNEKWFKEYDKWFAKNKSKQNSNLFVKKEFVENMTKGGNFWTSEADASQPKEHYYHYLILFNEGYIGTNEGFLFNHVLCVK